MQGCVDGRETVFCKLLGLRALPVKDTHEMCWVILDEDWMELRQNVEGPIANRQNASITMSTSLFNVPYVS
jgi:hypothetical protein